jgi:L-lactate dehydrogenase complex protein LldG
MREDVLARIRAAVAGAEVPPIPRDYRQSASHPDLMSLLAERLTGYRATVHWGPVASVVAEVAGTSLVVPDGVPPEWLPDGIKRIPCDAPRAALDAAGGVLTGAAVAIAETGTIVLDASPDQGPRIATLLPDLHICVVRPGQVVATVPEALARLRPERPLTFVSGPSATSDIELNRVEGVHGPRTLHVILTGPISREP